jgi:DNA ligase (NAD+)
MYSLQKFYIGEPIPSDTVYYITPKLDGAAIALHYINGKLFQAATRGNGEYGEDINHLIKTNTLKLDISDEIPQKGYVQISGEIVAPKEISNARNYAAGALNLKHSGDFIEKDVNFFAYDIQPTPFETYLGSLCLLKDLGFNTVNMKIADLYPQDGKVYRMDINKNYQNAGFTSKHPRGSFALKARSEGIKTKILDVTWNVGKSGKVTPVAILEPITIDGAKVSKATLNNPGFIEALGVEIGDSVMVERAGGIIPRIIQKAE